jgi:hypothetical protein
MQYIWWPHRDHRNGRIPVYYRSYGDPAGSLYFYAGGKLSLENYRVLQKEYQEN